jgi:hypothetical protein
MRLGIAVLAVSIGMLLSAPLAHGFIYWSSYEGNHSKIGRADLNGGDYRPSIVSNIYYGFGVATDGAHIYWSANGGGPPGSAAIGRAEPDGTSPNPAFRDTGWSSELFDVKAVGGQIYWLYGSAVSGQGISGAPSGGGSAYSVGSGTAIRGFDVENGYAYWSEGNHIVRAPLSDPGAVDRTWLDTGTVVKPGTVSAEGDYIYWTEIDETSGAPFEGSYGTSIGRAPIADPAAVVHELISNIRVRTVSGLDVEGEYVYWANAGDPGLPYPQNIPGSIGRASIGGGSGNASFIPLEASSEPRMLDVEDAEPVTPPPFVPQSGPLPLDRAIHVDRPYAVTTKNKKFTYVQGATPPRGRASISKKKVPGGTVFSYKIDSEATVKIEIKRLKAGRLVGKKCKPRNKANAKKQTCDLTEHTLTRAGKPGSNKVPYTGKVKGKILKPGKYRAFFTATATGGSGGPTSVAFTFVRPPTGPRS